jgi:ribosomal protein L37AE/L43A
MSDPTPRVQPFFCPYCGEQDLRPAATNGWHCRVCDRRFELSFIGLGSEGAS